MEQTKEVTPTPIQKSGTASNKALVQYLDAANNVLESETCWRSLPAVFRTLAARFEKAPDTIVKVIVPPEDAAKPIRNNVGEPVEIVLTQGPIKEALGRLAGEAVTPPVAMGKLQLLTGQLTDVSNLKGAIVTAVFGESNVSGFGMISSTDEVEDADIIVLVEAAANQVTQMKDEMRKLRPGIKFPSDAPNLILPGRFTK